MEVTLNTVALADGIELIDDAMLSLISGGLASDDTIANVALRDDRWEDDAAVGG